MQVNHILIPTDFSEKSLSALKVANTFIDLFGCTVDLIHVVPLIKYFSESMDHVGVPFDMEKEIYPRALDHAHEKLEKLAAQHIKKEYRGKLISIIERKSSEAIYKQANNGDYDLVLMSTKGEHESHFLRGGVAEKVIRHSHIPVLTLEEAFNKEEMKTILLPLDLSDISFHAIVSAFELAKEFGSTLVLFHAVELYAAGSDMVPYVPRDIDDEEVFNALLNKLGVFLGNHANMHLSIERNGTAQTGYLVQTLGANSHSIPFKVQINKGLSAHYEIVEYANEHADMVVMSTHGRTGFARVFLGSTTEQVAQRVAKPLLTVRPDYGEE